MKNFKKILSYFILFFAFCLICMGIVHADTIIQYKSIIVNDIEKYELIEQLINDNYDTYFTDINKENDIVIINGNTTTNEFYLYAIQSNITISNSNGSFSYGGYTYHIYTNNDYTQLTSVDNWGYWSPNTSYINTMFGGSYSFTSFGQDSTLQIINNTNENWTFKNFDNDNSIITLNSNSQINLIDVINALNDYTPTPPFTYCYPDDFLGQMSNISDFTITIKATTNALSYPILGSFDIISNKYMQSSDWNIDFSHTPDDIISTGSISCITNRCVFHFQAVVEDDIDEEVVLNYKFTPAFGVSMPTRIQLDTCNNNDLNVNFSYTYNLSDTNTNTNPDNTIITDDTNMNNWMQDGSLPDYSGLSDTSIIPDGPVDAILTLPLNVMNSLLNVLNSNTCQPLVLPIPFSNGQNLTLPCVSTLYAKINGLSTFLTWFSAIFSAFILYQYFINLYKWVDDTLTFRENNHFGGY